MHQGAAGPSQSSLLTLNGSSRLQANPNPDAEFDVTMYFAPAGCHIEYRGSERGNDGDVRVEWC